MIEFLFLLFSIGVGFICYIIFECCIRKKEESLRRKIPAARSSGMAAVRQRRVFLNARSKKQTTEKQAVETVLQAGLRIKAFPACIGGGCWTTGGRGGYVIKVRRYFYYIIYYFFIFKILNFFFFSIR